MNGDDRKKVDKDRISALSKLAEANFHAFERRAGFEWKVTFGLWTGLGLVAGYLLKFDVPEPNDWGKRLVLVSCGVLFLIYAFWWTPGIYERNESDKRKAYSYWDLMLVELGLPAESSKTEESKWRPGWFNYSHGSQVLITLSLLIVVLVIFLSHPNPRVPSKPQQTSEHPIGTS
jgi:hypothetical protein